MQLPPGGIHSNGLRAGQAATITPSGAGFLIIEAFRGTTQIRLITVQSTDAAYVLGPINLDITYRISTSDGCYADIAVAESPTAFMLTSG